MPQALKIDPCWILHSVMSTSFDNDKSLKVLTKFPYKLCEYLQTDGNWGILTKSMKLLRLLRCKTERKKIKKKHSVTHLWTMEIQFVFEINYKGHGFQGQFFLMCPWKIKLLWNKKTFLCFSNTLNFPSCCSGFSILSASL